ncbi:MAG: 30S ribosome-binding factor RbfA [Xanthomonadales bacterium]|nr:30S ribosome-binding factor RbfA [Xanthomonadales bacterium]
MNRSFSRSDRVAAEIRREVAVLVHQAVRDAALPSVSVSDVEVTKDLDVATIYVTALVGDTAGEAVAMLKELARDFRRELSRSMAMRRVPELRFRYDDSVDKGERIEQLLREEPGLERRDSGLDDEPGAS